jgi:hypothetical protein
MRVDNLSLCVEGRLGPGGALVRVEIGEPLQGLMVALALSPDGAEAFAAMLLAQAAAARRRERPAGGDAREE